MNYKQLLIDSGKRMLESGLTVETWGNLSLRDPKTGYIYLTPSAMPYNTISEEDVVVLDADGNFYTENYRSAKSRIEYICRGGIQTGRAHHTF